MSQYALTFWGNAITAEATPAGDRDSSGGGRQSLVVICTVFCDASLYRGIKVAQRFEASARAAGRLHHQRKHQLYLRGGSKFATSSEQFVEGGNNINYTFMRDQTSPLSMTYRLIGKITSTLSWWRIKISPPLWSNPEWDRNINLIVMRDQNLQPSMTNFDGGDNINFIFMRDQTSPPPQNNICCLGK